MALEHVVLVSLSEKAASGAELTRRFDSSVGYFWTATHQQIYRVLGRMEEAGWVAAEPVSHGDRRTTKVYAPTDAGREELRRWLAQPTPIEASRSDLGVRMRGAAYGDRAALLENVRARLDEHTKRRSLYEYLAARDFPEPDRLTGQDLDQYLVLRGGLRQEQFWIDWLTEYLHAHETAPGTPPTKGPDA